MLENAFQAKTSQFLLLTPFGAYRFISTVRAQLADFVFMDVQSSALTMQFEELLQVFARN
jgi:hypothetical protein